MGAVEVITLVNALLGVAFQLYNSVSQVSGDTPIESWESLVNANKLLQAKIDAEK